MWHFGNLKARWVNHNTIYEYITLILHTNLRNISNWISQSKWMRSLNLRATNPKKRKQKWYVWISGRLALHTWIFWFEFIAQCNKSGNCVSKWTSINWRNKCQISISIQSSNRFYSIGSMNVQLCFKQSKAKSKIMPHWSIEKWGNSFGSVFKDKSINHLVQKNHLHLSSAMHKSEK